MACAAFGPSPDWWMVIATVLAAAASLFVAIAALKSSKRANEISAESTRIASKAAQRDTEQRDLERAREQQLAREELSLSMLRVLVLLDNYVYAPPPGEKRGEMWQAIRSALNDALARADVYESRQKKMGLRAWFDTNVDNLVVHANTANNQSFMLESIQEMRSQITSWNNSKLSVTDLTDINHDGFTDPLVLRTPAV